MACGKPEVTPLAEYAKSLRQEAFELSQSFPMHVVSLKNILKMTEVRCHQDLLRDGILDKMDAVRGKAMFLSHQWVSNQHPDPDGKQFKAFQGAMSNLLSGSIVAQPGVLAAAVSKFLGFQWISESEATWAFCNHDLCVVWLLLHTSMHCHFPVPISWCECRWGSTQCYCQHSGLHWQVWLRCGSVSLDETCKHALNAEPRQVTLGSTWHSTFLTPGDGKFTVDTDREVVGKLLKDMVHKKLHSLLVKSDFPSYRLLLNLQHVWLSKCDTAPVPGLLGDLGTDPDEIVEEFLLQHAFSKLCEYDKAGWSPLCYAALGGNPQVVEALLCKRANPNETLRRSSSALFRCKGTAAVAICGRFGNNEAMRILVCAQADPNKPDCHGRRPLFDASIYSDNVDGARLLLEARADPSAVDAGGNNAFRVASMWGASMVVKELLNFPGAVSRQELLHFAILFGSSAEHMSLLLEIGCDINEQFRLHGALPGVHLLLGFLAVKHCLFAPTPVNTFAYHWHDATPLMMSILLGSYSISQLLLEAKARVDLRNSRKQTAFDLAIKLDVPDALLWELWRCGAGNHASHASISWWNSNAPEEQAEDQVSVVASSIPMEMVQDPDPTVSVQFWESGKLSLLSCSMAFWFSQIQVSQKNCKQFSFRFKEAGWKPVSFEGHSGFWQSWG